MFFTRSLIDVTLAHLHVVSYQFNFLGFGKKTEIF